MVGEAMHKRVLIYGVLLCFLSAFGQGLTLKNPAYVAILSSPPASGGGGTFGRETIGGSSAGLSVNEATGSRFTAPANATVTKITAYVQGVGASRNFKALVYSDSGGGTPAPVNLVGTSASGTATTTAGWVEVSCSIGVSAGTVYWLAVVYDGSGTIFYESVGGQRMNHQGANDYGTPTATWTGGSDFDGLVMSIYATY